MLLLDYIGVYLDLFRYVGENAMSFYCLHWIILNVVKYSCQKNGIISDMYVFIALLLFCVLLLPILNKMIKYTSLKTLIGL